MKIKKLFAIFIFASISVMGIAGCSSNQKIETVDVGLLFQMENLKWIAKQDWFPIKMLKRVRLSR